MQLFKFACNNRTCKEESLVNYEATNVARPHYLVRYRLICMCILTVVQSQTVASLVFGVQHFFFLLSVSVLCKKKTLKILMFGAL